MQTRKLAGHNIPDSRGPGFNVDRVISEKDIGATVDAALPQRGEL